MQPQPELAFKHLSLESITVSDAIGATVAEQELPADGLMMPLIVVAYEDRFHLIDGYKRFARLAADGAAGCNCGILTPAPNALQTLLLRITLNKGRTFTIAEKLYFVTELASCADAHVCRDALAILSGDRSELANLGKCTACSDSVKLAVARGHVDLPLAPVLDQLPPGDRQAVLDLYAGFPLSRQTQKEFSDWLPELGFRERCSIAEIIAAPEVQEIISHPKLNAPQKIEKVRQCLYERRFPTIVRAKKRWEAQASAVNPDAKSVVFKAADAFEKNRLEMKITITSAAQAEVLFSRLSSISPTAWDQLIYPAHLYGDFKQPGDV